MKEREIYSYKKAAKKIEREQSSFLCDVAIDIFNSDAKNLKKEYTEIKKRKIGDKAPNFKLLNTLNEPIELYHILETQKIVLTFYRGTWCPYCNLMLRHYQNALPQIQKAGATLLAVSPQTPQESLNIKNNNNLQFQILSDNGNIVAKEFTTIHKMPARSLAKMIETGNDYDSYYSDEASELPIPTTFIIEKSGIISFAKTEGGDYRSRVKSTEIIKALNKNN